MTLRPTLLLLAALAPLAVAQTPTVATIPTPTYDVVSITPDKSDSGSSGWNTQDSSFTATNVNLAMLVSFAYDIRTDLISGLPGWADHARYNLTAKIVDPDLPTLKKLTDAQHNEMLAKVLGDRFGLKTHTETKQVPVYNLVIGSHGQKVKRSTVQDQTKGTWSNNDSGSTGTFTGTTIPVSALIDFLSSNLHRTVIDKTNLSGLFDFNLTWALDRPAAAGGDTGQPADAGPSLFSALTDQLGLKLVPAKGPVTTLVVDHADPPTPN